MKRVADDAVVKRATGQVERFRDHRGRVVRLTTERWHHIIQHSEMTGQKRNLRMTVADPERVLTSRLDPTVRLYDRRFSASPVGAKYLMTAVKLLEDNGFIITAFYTDEIKGGAEVWAK